MYLPALQSQHSAYFRTDEGKQNSFLFYLLLIFCSFLQIDFWELGKMWFYDQGVTHKQVSRIEKTDSRIFFLRYPGHNSGKSLYPCSPHLEQTCYLVSKFFQQQAILSVASRKN